MQKAYGLFKDGKVAYRAYNGIRWLDMNDAKPKNTLWITTNLSSAKGQATSHKATICIFGLEYQGVHNG